MSIADSLTAYTTAQKYVALAVIALGVALLTAAVVIYLQSAPNKVLQGFKISALACGLFALVGGGIYYGVNDRLHDKLMAQHGSDPAEFVSSEKKRMSKVAGGTATYLSVMAGIVVVALGVALFVGRPYWAGVAYAVAILALLFMTIEANSHVSIVKHNTFMQAQSGD